jgi:hypothetical protein
MNTMNCYLLEYLLFRRFKQKLLLNLKIHLIQHFEQAIPLCLTDGSAVVRKLFTTQKQHKQSL